MSAVRFVVKLAKDVELGVVVAPVLTEALGRGTAERLNNQQLRPDELHWQPRPTSVDDDWWCVVEESDV
jgi:hypothetical protein